MPRRRLLATHAAPGGGKSRFLDVLASLCGPRSASTALAQRVWAEFHQRQRDAKQEEDAKSFEHEMERRIAIAITFNDFQTLGTSNLPIESALALRVIHRFVRTCAPLRFPSDVAF